MICNLCGKKIHFWQLNFEMNDYNAVGERINKSEWAHGKCIDKVHIKESQSKSRRNVK